MDTMHVLLFMAKKSQSTQGRVYLMLHYNERKKKKKNRVPYKGTRFLGTFISYMLQITVSKQYLSHYIYCQKYSYMTYSEQYEIYQLFLCFYFK